jgi:mannosyltransferase OCH1-like enzyme
MIIHQIFGLMGDSKMNDLFKKSHQSYKDFCTKNNYEYILWDADACNELIQEYPDYVELYNSVRFSIMKVDIIRFIILHKYGGLYADLDTIPNCETLKASTFIIAKKYGLKRTLYEMEILQSIKGHPYLLSFLDYVKTQIKEKDKLDIYTKWKCRYVYQTTGPHSLSRFLKDKEDIDEYIINEPLTLDNSLNLRGNEDFISYPSCSYLEKM